MATISALILAVRRRVADVVEEQSYDDTYYEGALDFALSKLNFDWGTEFLTPDAVTTPYDFLLIKLATIEMCYVRMTETPSGTAETGSTAYQSITVPDLTVMKAVKAARTASEVWQDLAEALQSEYDGELENGMGSGGDGEIQQAKMVRQGLRTGGMKPYTLATPLTAPDLTTTVDGSDVILTWDEVLSTYFWGYEIWRGTDIDLTDGERQATISDNHDPTWTDESVASGTYYYKLVVVDTTGLEADSSVLMVVVP